jgi:multidrug efflux system membrane fusion protein
MALRKLTSASKPVLFPAIITLIFLLAGCGRSAPPRNGQRGPQGPVPVSIAAAERRDVPIYLTGLGSVTAFNTIVVKTRVDGQLVQVAFKEGQEVQKGDLLAVIDPRPFEVALNQAKANLEKDRSTLQDAKVNLARFQELFKEGVIPKQQLDTQSALVGQLEGTIGADVAQVENAKLNLHYTRITAPAGGRVGLRLVDPGNMVHASDQNGLLVITQLQPIAVLFTLPEDQLPAVASHMRQGQLQVDVYSRDDRTKLASGTLLTIDNQIDPTTGTGRLKAIFENRDHSLWPNQFVNVKLRLEIRKDTIVIPAAAIQHGPQGAYTYVVKPDKTVEVRSVGVAFTQGNLASISNGVAAGELVVTDGQDKLQAGSQVQPRSGAASGNRMAQSQPQLDPQQRTAENVQQQGAQRRRALGTLAGNGQP